MQFTTEETTKIKAMLLYVVRKKQMESDFKCGFHITELNIILEELVKEGKIIKRPTINNDKYFLTNK